MFVKWTAKKEYGIGGYRPRINVSLAESHRIEGKPRQRIVAFLASGDELGLRRTKARWEFWSRVYTRLRRVPALTEAQRTRFVETIARVVPKFPTPEEAAYLESHPDIALRQGLENEAARREGRKARFLWWPWNDWPDNTPIQWPPPRSERHV